MSYGRRHHVRGTIQEALRIPAMAYDVADLFAERHAYLACALTALAQQVTAPARDACLGDLTAVMAAHLRSVDKGIAVLRRLGPSPTLDQVAATYGSAGLALATMVAPTDAPPTEDGFAAQLNSLGAAVQAMCRMEQVVVIPALEAYLGAHERIQLLVSMQNIFDEHVGAVGIDGFPPRVRPGAVASAQGEG
jgi:hypothetical protein